MKALEALDPGRERSLGLRLSHLEGGRSLSAVFGAALLTLRPLIIYSLVWGRGAVTGV